MEKNSRHLLRALQELGKEEFKKFKFFLNGEAKECRKAGVHGMAEEDQVPQYQLEEADRMDLVKLIMTHYRWDWLRITLGVLRRLPRLDLVDKLQSWVVPADGSS